MRRLAVSWTLALVACGDEGSGFVRVKAEGYFEPTELDFAERALGQSHSLDLQMTNSSTDELLVTDVLWEPSSDAFAARLAEGPTLKGARFSRGQKRALKIIFGPSEEITYATKMVLVSDQLEVELPVRGVGRRVEPARFAVSPASITFLEAIEVGREARQSIRLDNVGELPGYLSRVMTPSEMTVLDDTGGSATPSDEVPAGGGLDLALRYRPSVVGPFDEVALFVTNGGVESELPVRGSAVPAGTLACDRASIDFGPVARGGEARRTVICDVTGGLYTLEQLTFSSSGSVLTMENASASNGVPITRLTFDIVFRPLGLPRAVSGAVNIQSAHGQQTGLTVAGVVEAPPPEDAELALVLSWTTPNTDFDLHFVRAGGVPFQPNQDCHFGQKTLDWNQLGNSRDDPYLDRDSVTGPGSEQLTMIDGATGTYQVFVQFFHQPAARPSVDLTLQVQVQGGPNLNLQRTMSACGNVWRVGVLHFENSPPTFESINDETNVYASFATTCP